ncbi:MAG: hypothetical protein GY909_15655 [Oligoflexia bacterium]|nr:hypothetical protein [Oligoflexia bacterium]
MIVPKKYRIVTNGAFYKLQFCVGSNLFFNTWADITLNKTSDLSGQSVQITHFSDLSDIEYLIKEHLKITSKTANKDSKWSVLVDGGI